MWPRRSKVKRKEKIKEAQKALRTSRIDLQKIKMRDPDIERVSLEMLRIRERNHFAEQISVLMSNKRKGFL